MTFSPLLSGPFCVVLMFPTPNIFFLRNTSQISIFLQENFQIDDASDIKFGPARGYFGCMVESNIGSKKTFKYRTNNVKKMQRHSTAEESKN